jgi:hypothetical protein
MTLVRRPPLPGIDPGFGAVECVCCKQFFLSEEKYLERFEKGANYRCELCRIAGHGEDLCCQIHKDQMII